MLRLQCFAEQLLGVEVHAVDRIRASGKQVQECLILDVTYQQSRRAACVDTEVALNLFILVVHHVVVVVTTDVRTCDHVVELLDQSAQYHVGRVHQHLHAADGIRRCALLTLQDSRHASLLIDKLGRHLDNAGQFGLMAVELKRGKGFRHIVHVIGCVPYLAAG